MKIEIGLKLFFTVLIFSLPFYSHSQISTFDSTDEGWTVVGDAISEIPQFYSVNGNPGGYIMSTDQAIGGNWYWVAPSNFLGNKLNAFGQFLQFDLKQSELINQFDAEDVIITGSGITIVCDLANNPDTTWTHYAVPLDTTIIWRINDLNGSVATISDIKNVLMDITDIEIRGEYIEGPDEGGLDNVILPELLYYRSRQVGNWDDNNTWESSPVSNFQSGVLSPANTSPNAINSYEATIRSNHIVTVTNNVITRKLTVNSNGNVHVNTGIHLKILSN